MKELQFEKLLTILRNQQYLNLKVITDSMAPLINPGDSVKVVECKIDQLKKWDIVVFKNSNNKIITHCYWKQSPLQKNTFLTRPLKNFKEFDPPISSTNLLGIVTNFKVSTPLKIYLFFRNLFF